MNEELNVDIEKLCQDIINYENKEKKSWNSSYKEIASKYIDKNDTDKLDTTLVKVVCRLTEMGYDIEDFPFGLKRYK